MNVNLNNLIVWLAASCLILSTGCRSNPPPDRPPELRILQQHATTIAIDRIVIPIPDDEPQGGQKQRGIDGRRLMLDWRWQAVQNAVAYRGTTHRDAFFGSRSYWHTSSTRGISWTQDQQGDLDVFFTVPGKGNVRVLGDVNADLAIGGNSIVHILGDLNATLDLQGVCEVVIGGNLTEKATIICDGQLELFVGGDSAGILGSTASSTIVIDGNASGTIQASAPATVLTITGDLLGEVLPPKNKEALLTLRVDGYVPTAKMLDFANAGFTRVNATIGLSDSPPGLYPQDPNAPRPKARWVVLEQRTDDPQTQ
ncbi:MAG: hypothetical protein AAGB26_18715 [Planctomycetota bacterium]